MLEIGSDPDGAGYRADVTMRTTGVEEEFLLIDAATGRPLAAADDVLAGHGGDQHARGGAGGRDRDGGVVHRELTLQQVEIASAATTDLAQLRASLLRLRRDVAQAAAASGALLVASGTSPVPASTVTTPTKRYRRMTELYGLTAREQLTCGCHVHVGVSSDEEAVGALDRIRPWLPLLLAVATNSPFWQGLDTSYASYRSQVWGRWPTSGATAPFGSAAAYHDCVTALLDTGAILDEGMIYFDARLSRHYPTLEIRVADVTVEVDDAVLVAALAAALVERGARDGAAGLPPPDVRTELIRLASWRAARSGLSGELVDVLDRRPLPAAEALDRLVAHVRPVLEDAGTLDDVRALVTQVLGRGTGADRQRAAHRTTGSVTEVVRLLAERTVAG